MKQNTVALIKPDGVKNRHIGTVLSILEATDLSIHSIVTAVWSIDFAAEFYKEHRDRDFFHDLVRFMSSGPTVAMLLRGEDAIARWRAIMGPTDPEKAPFNTIRYELAAHDGIVMHNVVHGSDSEASAIREARLIAKHVYSRFGEGIDWHDNTIPAWRTESVGGSE